MRLRLDREALETASRPAHVDPLDGLRREHRKGDDRLAPGQIARRRLQGPPDAPRARGGLQKASDLCADRVAVTGRSLERDPKRPTPCLRVVAVEPCRALVLGDDDVQVAVAVVVRRRQRATDDGAREEIADRRRHGRLQNATGGAPKQLRGLPIGNLRLVLEVEDVAVDLHEVDVTVEVEVLEKEPEGDAIERLAPDRHAERALDEKLATVLQVKGGRLSGEVPDGDHERTTAILPRRIDPHPGERRSGAVRRETRLEPAVLEASVAEIAQHEVGDGVVGDEEVRGPVAVVVFHDDAEGLATEVSETRLAGRVDERAITASTKEPRSGRREHRHRTVVL